MRMGVGKVVARCKMIENVPWIEFNCIQLNQLFMTFPFSDFWCRRNLCNLLCRFCARKIHSCCCCWCSEHWLIEIWRFFSLPCSTHLSSTMRVIWNLKFIFMSSVFNVQSSMKFQSVELSLIILKKIQFLLDSRRPLGGTRCGWKVVELNSYRR